MIDKNLTVPRIAMCAKNRSRRMIRGYAIIVTWPGDTEVPRIVTWITKIHIAFP